MNRSRPAWRRVIDGVEQRLAEPLEDLVRHDGVGVGLTVLSRAVSTARGVTERGSRRVLHALNIPAASDINRLLAHIAVVEREVRSLSARASGTVPARGVHRPRTPAIGPGPAE